MKELPKYLAQFGERDIAILSQRLCEPVRELRVNVSEDGAAFLRISEGAKPKKFGLSEDEADGFCMAWLAFRGAQYEAQQAEITRLGQVREQAFTIARDCPAIIIKGQDVDVWDVELAEIGFSYAGLAYGPDELLKKVERAKQAYDDDAAIKKSVEKAFAIEAKIEGLAIEKHSTQAYYHVRFHDFERTWAIPENLLKAVKEIVSAYLEDLLAKHEDIHVIETTPKTTDQKAIWTVSHDGLESVQCIGMGEVLHTVEQFIAQKVTNN